jgi:uncharacterized phiE125 gp8 family phage protein
MPLQIITPPTAEPISLVEAKAHLRVTDTADDAQITAFIAAARKFAETNTQCQVIAARWKLVLDAFPGPSLMGIPLGQAFSLPGHAILLPKSPTIQVVSVQYLDMSGTLQTMPTTDYVADLACQPARITPVFGKIWPISLPQIGAVTVTFDAGYAAPITADITADTITVSGWKAMIVNDVVRLANSGGALPTPLLINTDYFIQTVVAAGVYKLSTIPGGAAINLTDIGTGLNYLGASPADLEGLKSWIKIRLSSIYENREEILTIRGQITELPYIDNLLDPYRVMTF